MKTLLVIIVLIALLALRGSATSPSMPTPMPTMPAPTQPPPLPLQKVLESNYHVFQTFNNCGPAALSMALRFYGIEVSQEELGEALRPYQVASGINDDKSVTLQELGNHARSYSLTPFHRPNGSPQLLRRFIAQGMPVIIRTWTTPTEDIGHFRVIKGYTDNAFIQDDSLQGKNITYTEDELNTVWSKFHYEYLVLAEKEKVEEVTHILGADSDEKEAWRRASIKQGSDPTSQLNVVVALTNAGNYSEAVEVFREIPFLPPRALWYNIEPFIALYETGNDDELLRRSSEIFEGGNRAYAELYVLRGAVYKRQGNSEAAELEYNNAIFYNKNIRENERYSRFF